MPKSGSAPQYWHKNKLESSLSPRFYGQVILTTDPQEVVIAQDASVTQDGSPELFAFPNADCSMFNRFGAGNLSVVERNGKGKAIRRLYRNHRQQRFSKRKGSLMQYTHLPEETVVRVINPAHAAPWQREIWVEEQETRVKSVLNVRNGLRVLPTS